MGLLCFWGRKRPRRPVPLPGRQSVKPPFKPGVSRSVHLFAAPFLWTVVGCLLMVRGWDWLDPGRGRLLVLAALFAGTLKSLLVLDRVAARAVGTDRPLRRPHLPGRGLFLADLAARAGS